MSEPTMFIDGPVGPLEAMLEMVSEARLAVICHPHPLYQGTMHNKVVTTLAKAYAQCGYSTLRFNYRGVGKSAGQYGDMTGEISDAMAVQAFVQQKFPAAQLSLAGFSFGGYVAASVAGKVACQNLVTVAPAVNHYDYEQLDAVSCPWLLVAAEADELVPVSDIRAWLAETKQQPQYLELGQASHFFHGQLIQLREALVAWLRAQEGC